MYVWVGELSSTEGTPTGFPPQGFAFSVNQLVYPAAILKLTTTTLRVLTSKSGYGTVSGIEGPRPATLRIACGADPDLEKGRRVLVLFDPPELGVRL